MKLAGYSQVAVIMFGCKPYCFALYDDNIKVGDSVIVSGSSQGQPLTVSNIISPEEATELTHGKSIVSEVICKVDITAYVKRVERRKKAQEIKSKMDNEIKKLQKEEPYETYAAKNPVIAELYRLYKEYAK